MNISIIKEPMKVDELKQIAKNGFGDFVKAVVDVELELMAIGGELHADEEITLSEQGSKREYMWGINIYPDQREETWIEFDSMINIKPHLGNRSRGVEDIGVQKKVRAIVDKLIYR